MKNKVTITENELKNIINECINNMISEGFGDTMKGAWNGAKMGNDKMQANNSSLHATSYGLSHACEIFGQIFKLLSNNDIEEAKKYCKWGYKECKSALNSTADNGNMVTTQYGAQPRVN